MCRWITVLSSDPMSLSDIILAPSNSLIQLSKDASFHPGYSDINNHVTNGDGFGVGWYHTNYAAASAVSAAIGGAHGTATATVDANVKRNTSTSIPNDHRNPNEDDIGLTLSMTLSTPLSSTGMPGGNDDETMQEKDDDNRRCLVLRNNTSNKRTKRMKVMNAAVFKDTQPAWNNANLRELCLAIQSHCMVAHVRAASSFAGISQQNCHPYKAGRLLFCHNGRLEQFDIMRRSFHHLLSDEAFVQVKGTTDSEVIFALLCTYLDQDEYNTATGNNNKTSPYLQTEPFGYIRLTNAIKKVLRTIEQITIQCGIHETTYNTCNFALTDGETMIVTRFCNKSPVTPPPSLYFAFGDSDELYEELTNDDDATSTATAATLLTSPPPSPPRHSSSMNSMATSSIGSTASSTSRYGSHSQNGGNHVPLSSIFDNNNDNNNDSMDHDNNNEVVVGSDSSHSRQQHYNKKRSESVSEGSTSSDFDEKWVDVENFESQPGTVYADVDVHHASFIVASCPLTRTHTWHPMPKNSIMWYTRGTLPELRLLKKRDHTNSQHHHHKRHLGTQSYIFSS